MLELTYNAELGHGVWLGADLQRIANPAYNAARGPVSIGSLRLHTEF
ncbi:hypothetical protein RCH09_000469 [Actimicrobium sp. GrIS 1.19]|nr:hypothetical protein [Actimicrobium sp. GrIS 1.19]